MLAHLYYKDGRRKSELRYAKHGSKPQIVPSTVTLKSPVKEGEIIHVDNDTYVVFACDKTEAILLGKY